MANVEKLDEELSSYESESESDDSYLPLSMRRRRQASDDEDFGGEDNADLHFRPNRTVTESSDEDFCTDEESEPEKSEEEGVTTVPMKLNVGIDGATADIDGESAKEGVWTVPETLNVGITIVTAEIDGESVTERAVTMPVKQVFEKKKKLAESYVIAVSGAYYMHDDRLSKNGGRRLNRRKHDGRNLWKSKDEQKWDHDKFEELTLQETQSKQTAFIEVDKTANSCNQVHSNNQRQDSYLKEVKTGRNVKGRWMARYKPTERSNSPNLQAKENQYGSFLEKKSSTSSARVHIANPTIRHPQFSVQKGLPFSGYQPTPYSDDFDRFSSSFSNPYIKQSESGSLLGLQPNKFQFAWTENRGGITHGGGRSSNMSRNYHDNLFPNAHLRGQHQSVPDMTCEPGSLLGLQRNKFQFARTENRGGITQGGGRSSILCHNYHDNLFPNAHFRGQYQSDPDMTCESGFLLRLQRNKFQFARTENRGGITQGGGRSSNLSRNYHDNLFPNAHSRGQHQSDPDMTCAANEFTRGSKTSFKPELLSEENDQYRIKPRRYSTMNFNK